MAFGDDVQELSAGGGRYFKPGDYANAAAFLIEPKDFERQRPGTKYAPKDTIHADITIFADAAELAAGTPSVILEGSMIQQTLLVRDLEKLVGKITISTLTRLPARDSNQPAWAWVNANADIKAAVIAYGEAREAAKVAALASAPGFD